MFKWLFASAAAESVSAAVSTSAPAFTDTLMGKGLTTTVLGLGGVFLVLFLFFLIIKGMQKIKE